MSEDKEQAKEDANASNIGAWCNSEPLLVGKGIPRTSVNVKRSTKQAFGVIRYNKSDNRFQKVRNSIVASQGIMRAYGNGEVFGMGNESSIDCVEGKWPCDHGIALLSFDSMKDAENFFDTASPMNDLFLYSRVDYYIVPLANPAKAHNMHRFFQFEVYDIKNRENFQAYMSKITNIAQQSNGILIAASECLNRYKSSRNPHYIVMIQWMNKSDFESFNNSVRPLFTNSGAACGTRIIFEVDAHGPLK